jgi:hypothetical protein
MAAVIPCGVGMKGIPVDVARPHFLVKAAQTEQKNGQRQEF